MTDLSVLVRRYQERLESVMLAGEDVAHEVVDNTPVLSGSLVLSWSASRNGARRRNTNLPVPAGATAPYGRWNNPSAGGYKATARNRATAAFRGARVGDTLYFVNGQTHARRIEYTGHSYMKAPRGMRDLAVMRWREFVNQRVIRARGI